MGSLWRRAISGLKTFLLTWFIGMVLVVVLGVVTGESSTFGELVRLGFGYALLFYTIVAVVVTISFLGGFVREKAS